MYGAILVAVLSVLGGLVAFLGDRVGMRVGRRRVTLFGLRPKYTSMVITVVTGILIVTATLGIMAVVSKDVRTALFHMKKLQQDLSTTRVELVRTEDHAAKLATAVGTLNSQVRQKEKEYESLVSRYESTLSRLNIAIQRRNDVEQQLGRVGEQLQNVSREYDVARNNLLQTQSSLKQTETDLRFAQSRLAPLTAIQSQLTAVIDQLTSEKDRLNREVDALTAETVSLKEGLAGMLGRRMVFHTGEIVLSVVIDCGRPASEIRAELLTVHLKKANEVALSRGAQVPGSETDALRLRPVDLQEAVDQLTALKGKAVLRILSSTNTVAQEPVLVSLQVLPDELIYTSGEVIAETKVNGDSDVNAVMQRILALLEEVNWRAIQKGMVSDLQGTVGEISTWQEVEDVIAEVRKSQQPSVIQAIAATDTWRARGPLQVKLVIRP